MNKSNILELNKNLIACVLEWLPIEAVETMNEIRNERVFSILLKMKKNVPFKIKSISERGIFKTTYTIHSFLHVPKYKENSIICGCTDGYLRVYDINNLNLSVTSPFKHEGYVHKLIDLKNKNRAVIASCSDDNTVKVWDLPDFSCICTLNFNHIVYLLNIIKYKGEKILIVSTYTQLIFHSINEKPNGEYEINSLFNLKGHENYIYCLLYLPKINPDLVITGGYGKKMHFWSIESKNSFNFEAHNNGIWSLIYLKNFKENVIASASWDKSIKLWDIHTKTLLANYIAHSKMIYGLCNFKKIDNRFMVSSGYDNSVKIWKITDDLKFEMIHESVFDTTVRICSIEFINFEFLLFCSVTNRGFYLYKINAF